MEAIKLDHISTLIIAQIMVTVTTKPIMQITLLNISNYKNNFMCHVRQSS